jgi:hypothetical protein
VIEREGMAVKKGTQVLKMLDSKKKEEGVYGAVSELPHLRAL